MHSPATLRQWASLILQVQADQITATEAARQMGVSRKTYYQWEQRALQSLMDALQPGQPGRPRSAPSPQIQQLQQRIQTLEQQLETTEQVARLRELLVKAKAPQPRAKKGGSSKRSSP
jgi:transposase